MPLKHKIYVSRGKQMNIRMPSQLLDRVEAVGSALGLDVSSLIRMLVLEHLPRYERRIHEHRSSS